MACTCTLLLLLVFPGGASDSVSSNFEVGLLVDVSLTLVTMSLIHLLHASAFDYVQAWKIWKYVRVSETASKQPRLVCFLVGSAPLCLQKGDAFGSC